MSRLGWRSDAAMRDTELYRHQLGLVAPWEVSRVELSADGGRIDVWVDHPRRTRFACSPCELEFAGYGLLIGPLI